MDEHSTHTCIMKLCCMLYPGNSVCCNTKHLTTISSNGRTACPSKGAVSSSQQLGNSRIPTQSLPGSPSSSSTQLRGAACRTEMIQVESCDLGRQDRELLSPPPTALVWGVWNDLIMPLKAGRSRLSLNTQTFIELTSFNKVKAWTVNSYPKGTLLFPLLQFISIPHSLFLIPGLKW